MKQKLINRLCPNYDEIIDYEYSADDVISKHLVETYRNFIFKSDDNKENYDKISHLDEALACYFNDSNMFHIVQNYFQSLGTITDTSEYSNSVVLKVIHLHKQYQDTLTQTVAPTRWI